MTPPAPTRKDELLNQAAREYKALHEALQGLNEEYFVHVTAGVPEERFQPGKTAWKIVDGNSAHHYHEHAGQIRAWRRQRGV